MAKALGAAFEFSIGSGVRTKCRAVDPAGLRNPKQPEELTQKAKATKRPGKEPQNLEAGVRALLGLLRPSSSISPGFVTAPDPFSSGCISDSSVRTSNSYFMVISPRPGGR